MAPPVTPRASMFHAIVAAGISLTACGGATEDPAPGDAGASTSDAGTTPTPTPTPTAQPDAGCSVPPCVLIR